MKQPVVYIMTNKPNGILYIGVTSNLQKKAWAHKNQFSDGFSKKYKMHRLVYYEIHEDMYSAITREKQLKRWKEHRKLESFKNLIPNGTIYMNHCFNLKIIQVDSRLKHAGMTFIFYRVKKTCNNFLP